jgi:hypothetical protein
VSSEWSTVVASAPQHLHNTFTARTPRSPMPPLEEKTGGRGKRPGCEGASLCRWKMRVELPRSKNKNSDVGEMSSPPGLWLAGHVASCEQRGRDGGPFSDSK